MPRASLIVVSLIAALAGGCSTVDDTLGSLVPGSTEVSPQVLYVGADRLAVHDRPTAASVVIGRLALSEKVTRTRLQDGFAYVTEPNGRLSGWVDDSQLIDQLPTVAAKPSPVPRRRHGEVPSPDGSVARDQGGGPVEPIPAPEAAVVEPVADTRLDSAPAEIKKPAPEMVDPF